MKGFFSEVRFFFPQHIHVVSFFAGNLEVLLIVNIVRLGQYKIRDETWSMLQPINEMSTIKDNAAIESDCTRIRRIELLRARFIPNILGETMIPCQVSTFSNFICSAFQFQGHLAQKK